MKHRLCTSLCWALLVSGVYLGSSPTVVAFGVAPARRTPLRDAAGLPAPLAGVVSEVQEGGGDAGTASPIQRRFMIMTEEEDRLLKEKGDHEARLMANNLGPLRAHKVKTRSGRTGGGFGGSGGGNKSKGKAKKKSKGSSGSTTVKSSSKTTTTDFTAQAKAHAKVLHQDGIVRIDNILSEPLADQLKDYLVDLRARATADIENGVIQDSQERFADVLLNQNRCDLKIPLGPEPVNQALHHVLHETPIRALIEHVFDSYGGGGPESTLYELNCFMSNQGARRQLVHADSVCVEPGLLHEDEPVMLTCFIALQDTDVTMGPTTWILGTHNRQAHTEFFETDSQPTTQEGEESSKDRVLRTRPKAVGTLSKGACAVFDPRTLHCAGGNECKDPNMTRALFYISFKNPRVDHPGSPSCSGYGIADAELTMRELCDDLTAKANGQAARRIDFMSCFP